MDKEHDKAYADGYTDGFRQGKQAALSSRDTEIREVLEGLVTCVVDEGGGPRMHWCPLGEDSDMECGPSCDAARDLYTKLQPLPSENPGASLQK